MMQLLGVTSGLQLIKKLALSQPNCEATHSIHVA